MFRLRLDRDATVYAFHPLSRITVRGSGPRIPILMYHGVRVGSSARHPYYETNTSPTRFAEQMKYLRDQGYQALNLGDAIRRLELGEAGNKHVVITFDDGLRNFYTNAYPVLREFNFSATVFMVTSLAEDQSLPSGEKEFLTWAEVRELHSNGMQIGSHTVTHPKLKYLSTVRVDQEIGQSKRTIEDKLGQTIDSFSYPFAFPETDGHFISKLEEILLKYGYKNGVSTIIGTAGVDHNRFFLPRLPVNNWDDLQLFRAKLEGGYDWLHAAQYFIKRLKRLPHKERKAHHEEMHLEDASRGTR